LTPEFECLQQDNIKGKQQVSDGQDDQVINQTDGGREIGVEAASIHDAAQAWAPKRLGARIKAVRLERGISLETLAKKSKVSPSFLSAVENGQSDLSVGRLLRIATALAVRLSDLVDVSPLPAYTICRHGDYVNIGDGEKGLRVYALAPSIAGNQEYALSVMEAGAVIDDVTTRAERFLYVVEGAMRIDFSDGQCVTLDVGDSACIGSTENIKVSNIYAGPTRVVGSVLLA
jgi:transcriptional regulator with XRE-family HTH domain